VPSRLRWVPVANRSDGKLCRAQGVSVVARAIGWPGWHEMNVENELICQWLKANFLENSNSYQFTPPLLEEAKTIVFLEYKYKRPSFRINSTNKWKE